MLTESLKDLTEHEQPKCDSQRPTGMEGKGALPGNAHGSTLMRFPKTRPSRLPLELFLLRRPTPRPLFLEKELEAASVSVIRRKQESTARRTMRQERMATIVTEVELQIETKCCPIKSM